MRPQGNGVVELHDTKRKERGFCCMKLIELLTEDGVTEWDNGTERTSRQQPDNAHTQTAVQSTPGPLRRSRTIHERERAPFNIPSILTYPIKQATNEKKIG